MFIIGLPKQLLVFKLLCPTYTVALPLQPFVWKDFTAVMSFHANMPVSFTLCLIKLEVSPVHNQSHYDIVLLLPILWPITDMLISQSPSQSLVLKRYYSIGSAPSTWAWYSWYALPLSMGRKKQVIWPLVAKHPTSKHWITREARWQTHIRFNVGAVECWVKELSRAPMVWMMLSPRQDLLNVIAGKPSPKAGGGVGGRQAGLARCLGEMVIFHKPPTQCLDVRERWPFSDGLLLVRQAGRGKSMSDSSKSPCLPEHTRSPCLPGPVFTLWRDIFISLCRGLNLALCTQFKCHGVM